MEKTITHWNLELGRGALLKAFQQRSQLRQLTIYLTAHVQLATFSMPHFVQRKPLLVPAWLALHNGRKCDGGASQHLVPEAHVLVPTLEHHVRLLHTRLVGDFEVIRFIPPRRRGTCLRI